MMRDDRRATCRLGERYTNHLTCVGYLQSLLPDARNAMSEQQKEIQVLSEEFQKLQGGGSSDFRMMVTDAS